jgi:hypothetical protein
MSREWNLHYAEWIIADGQPDLRAGESFEWFAIEFWTPKGLSQTKDQKKSAVSVADYNYRVVAELIYLSEKACIIDFDLRAISTSDLIPQVCKHGDYVTGDIGIGLPLCTEIVPEDLSKTLRHKWEVNGILADMTPYISCPDNPKFYFRDESQIRYTEVSSTSSVRAHDYVLRCSQLT